MYTVFRITGDASIVREIESVGELMNKKGENTYTGLRKAGDGFSNCLCEGDEWCLHKKSITSFLNSYENELREAKAIGASVIVDIAIEPEDRISVGGQGTVIIDEELSSLICQTGVLLEVSSY